MCRGRAHTNEKLSQLYAQVLHHGPQIVEQRTNLINERIGPGARSLQERTRHIGDHAQPLDERTHVFDARGLPLRRRWLLWYRGGA